MLVLQTMKTLLLTFLFSFSSLIFSEEDSHISLSSLNFAEEEYQIGVEEDYPVAIEEDSQIDDEEELEYFEYLEYLEYIGEDILEEVEQEEVEQLDSDENPPLFDAITQCDFQTASKLLKEGADPSAKNTEGASAIHALSLCDDEKGSIEFLPTLIKYGADINNQDDDGNTSLILAIFKGKHKLLYSLLQSDVNVRIKDEERFNMLYAIVFFNSADVNSPYLKKSVNFILSKIDQEFINSLTDEDKMTVLRSAVLAYNIEFFRILASKDSLNNITDIHNHTPTIIALLLDLNSELTGLRNRFQYIHKEDINKIRRLSEISYILLSSLNSKDLNKKYRFDTSVNSLLSDLKQQFADIKKHRIEFPKFSSLYDASEPIRDFISRNSSRKNILLSFSDDLLSENGSRSLASSADKEIKK